jgi:hypothetical protein
VDRLADAERYRMRCLGRVRVQGKTTWTTIHEIYGCDPPEIVELKDATKEDVEAGLALYHDRDPAGAVRAFLAVLDANPADRGARFLLARAERAAEAELPPDWDGAITFLTK